MRPQILLDFARVGWLDPRARVTRASGGARLDAAGLLRAVSPNTARLTWADRPLGLWMEPTATNATRNARFEGAVLGQIGAGGALPTHMASATGFAGHSAQVLSTAPVNGVPTLVTRWFGASPGFVGLVPDTVLPAVPGEVVTFSTAVRLTGGTTTNTLGARWVVVPRNSGNGTLATYVSPTVPLSAAAVSHVLTTPPLPANTANFLARIETQTVPTQPFDFTWAKDSPQIERGAYPSSLILPATGSPAATTRAAESLTAPFEDFDIAAGTEGTLLVEARAAPGLTVSGAAQRAVQIDAGADADCVRIERVAGREMRAEVLVGGVSQGAVTSAGTVPDGADLVAVLGYSPGGMAMSLAGSAVVEAAPAAIPTPSRLVLGDWGGTIARVAWWPRRLSNAEVQSLARQGAIA